MNSHRDISLYVQTLQGGGAEKMVVLVANALAERGYKVDLVVANMNGPYVNLVSKKVVTIELGTRGTAYSALALWKYLRKAKPPVLFSTMTNANITALLARIFFKHELWLVISERSITSNKILGKASLKKFLTGFLMKKLYPNADSIVAISKGVENDLIENFNIPAAKIRVIYNMIEETTIEGHSSELYKQIFCEEKNSPLFIAVGRLVDVKNYPLLIEAFAKIRIRCKCKLLILGDGPEKEKIEELVNKAGLSDDVVLLGFVDNPRQYMQIADVLVLTSKWEGFGNVIIEAMSVGIQVVATNCESGPGEILENGKWGRLVPLDDSEALALAMESSMKDKNPPAVKDRARMFSHEVIIEDYIEELRLES